MIVVAGEALINLIGEGGVLRPRRGGGPLNTAMALGCLGVPVGFLGRLSNDHYGELVVAGLADSGAGDRFIPRRSTPTPFAVVSETADGDHEFTFYLTGTADADVHASDRPSSTWT